MPPEELPSSNEASETTSANRSEEKLWHKPVAILASGAIVVGAIMYVGGKEDQPEVSYGQESVRGDRPLPEIGQASCPEVPESYIKKAEDMLRQPENPDVTQSVRRVLFRSTPSNYLGAPQKGWEPVTGIMADRVKKWELPNVRQKVLDKEATKQGLTVFNGDAFAKHVYRANLTQGEAPLSLVLQATRQFIGQYGIDVAPIDENVGEHSLQLRMLTQTIEDVGDTKRALLAIAHTISRYPQEYIALSGIKKVYLGKNLRTSNENRRFNNNSAAMLGEEMWMDVKAQAIGDHFSHEIAHGVTQAMCGGPGSDHDDPQLERTTRNHPYDPEFNGRSYEDYHVELARLEKANPKDLAWRKELTLLQQNAVKEVATISDYARSKLAEDNAVTMGELSLHGVYRLRHAMAMPILRDKLSVVLGRLLYYRPAIANYFMQTSLKPEKTDNVVDDILQDLTK